MPEKDSEEKQPQLDNQTTAQPPPEPDEKRTDATATSAVTHHAMANKDAPTQSSG